MPIPPSPETHRIAKLLARAGIASRREIERMVAEGRVAKDGVVLDTPATVLASLDGVTVDGQPVAAPEPARLFLYHKPVGLLVTERDPAGRPTIYDRLPKGLPRVVPVGRLDLATEGLLLLTTDGGLKRQLELPATGVERSYRARAYGPITQEVLENLIEGVEIEGVRYGSINANLERRTGTNVWIEMTLTEGKNREVRRVLEYLGLQVSRLIRTRYGPFVLGDLPPGEVGEVRGHDVASFRKNPTRIDLPQPARAGRERIAVPDERRPVAPRSEPERPGFRQAPRRAVAAGERASTRPTRSDADRPGSSPPAGRRDRSDRRPDRAADTAARADDRAARPARGASRSARDGRPSKAGRGGAGGPDAIAKPARAARARSFREAGGQDERPPAPKPAHAERPRAPDQRPRGGGRVHSPGAAPRGGRPGSGPPKPRSDGPRPGGSRPTGPRPPRPGRPR